MSRRDKNRLLKVGHWRVIKWPAAGSWKLASGDRCIVCVAWDLNCTDGNMGGTIQGHTEAPAHTHTHTHTETYNSWGGGYLLDISRPGHHLSSLPREALPQAVLAALGACTWYVHICWCTTICYWHRQPAISNRMSVALSHCVTTTW